MQRTQSYIVLRYRAKPNRDASLYSSNLVVITYYNYNVSYKRAGTPSELVAFRY